VTGLTTETLRGAVDDTDSFKLPLDFADDQPSELWRPLDLGSRDRAAWGKRSIAASPRPHSGAWRGVWDEFRNWLVTSA
jgi:hypothetical protein